MNYRTQLRKILETCLASGEMVALHSYDDDLSAFVVGRVVEVVEAGVTLDMVDPDGQADEVEAFEWDEIEAIHFGTPYLVALAKLRDNGLAPNRRFKTSGKKAIEEAKSNGWAIGVDMAEESLEGFVLEHGEDCFVMETWEDYLPAGTYVIPMANVKKVTTTGMSLRAIEALR